MRAITTDVVPIAASSSNRPGPTTLSPTFLRSGSSAGPSSAASSTNTSEPHRSQGQDQWPSSGTPQHEGGGPGRVADLLHPVPGVQAVPGLDVDDQPAFGEAQVLHGDPGQLPDRAVGAVAAQHDPPGEGLRAVRRAG